MVTGVDKTMCNLLLPLLLVSVLPCSTTTDGVFPLRMPGVSPTRGEVYLCTGVEIGPDRR